MGIIGNIGGRFTSIKRFISATVTSGSGSANNTVYTCPANTVTKLSSIAMNNNVSETIINARFQLVDGLTGIVYNISSSQVTGFTAGVWRKFGFQTQAISVENAGVVSKPSTDGTLIPQSSGTDANLYNSSKYDPSTNSIILREGDFIRHAIAGFTTGSTRTTTYAVDVEEETRG